MPAALMVGAAASEVSNFNNVLAASGSGAEVAGAGRRRFRRNDIRAKFDEILRVLEREGVVQKA